MPKDESEAGLGCELNIQRECEVVELLAPDDGLRDDLQDLLFDCLVWAFLLDVQKHDFLVEHSLDVNELPFGIH